MRTRRIALRYAFAGVAALAAVTLLAGFTSKSARSTKNVDPNATMIVAIDTDPTQIDPRLNHSIVTIPAVWHMYEGLVTKNWFEGPDVVKIVPGLAESWTVSKDGKVYTFQIRKGVKFHDGTAMNAAAAEFSFRVIFDKTFQYFFPLANTFTAARLPFVTGYKATGPYTFQVTLSQPDGTFLERISVLNELSMVSPAAVQKYGNEGIAKNPVGTGPFVFRSYTPGSAVILDRYDGYWRGASKIKTLVFRIIPDIQSRTAALEAHEVHAAENLSVKNGARWTGRKDIRQVVRSVPSVTGCLLNFRQGPMTNKLFRQAINVAVNRDAINAIVFAGLASPVASFFGPGSGEAYDPTLPPYKFNPALARTLLKQAGLQGATIRMSQSLGNQNSIDALTIVQENLRDVGITMKIDLLDQTSWVGQLGRGIDGTGIDGMCAQGYGNETNTQGLDLFGTAAMPPKGFNTGFYLNAKVEAAAKAAVAAKSYGQYITALKASQKVVNADYAFFPFTSSLKVIGVAGNVVWKPAQSRVHFYYSAKLLK